MVAYIPVDAPNKNLGCNSNHMLPNRKKISVAWYPKSHSLGALFFVSVLCLACISCAYASPFQDVQRINWGNHVPPPPMPVSVNPYEEYDGPTNTVDDSDGVVEDSPRNSKTRTDLSRENSYPKTDGIMANNIEETTANGAGYAPSFGKSALGFSKSEEANSHQQQGIENEDSSLSSKTHQSLPLPQTNFKLRVRKNHLGNFQLRLKRNSNFQLRVRKQSPNFQLRVRKNPNFQLRVRKRGNGNAFQLRVRKNYNGFYNANVKRLKSPNFQLRVRKSDPDDQETMPYEMPQFGEVDEDYDEMTRNERSPTGFQLRIRKAPSNFQLRVRKDGQSPTSEGEALGYADGYDLQDYANTLPEIQLPGFLKALKRAGGNFQLRV